MVLAFSLFFFVIQPSTTSVFARTVETTLGPVVGERCCLKELMPVLTIMLFFCLDQISYKILKKHQQMVWRISTVDTRYNSQIVYDSFFALPFAAPPIGNSYISRRHELLFLKTGELRFSKPQPATPWSEPRNATQAGAPVHWLTVCYQVQSRSLRLFHQGSLWSPLS